MSKSQRRAEAIKRAKRKRVIVISIVSIAVIAIISIIIIFSSGSRENAARVYDGGGAIITLSDNGTFSPFLWHGEIKIGTFTESVLNGNTLVTFMYNGSTEDGWIYDNVLHIPDNWDDGHGHGTMFFLR